MKVDWRSIGGHVEVRVPIKRETSKVVHQNVMASSQSTTSEKPPETKEDESSSDESDNGSYESDSSSCPDWDKYYPYYCKSCRNKIYWDSTCGNDNYMTDERLCWNCYDYVRKAIRRNSVY